MIYKKLDYKSTTAQILLNIKAINFNIEKPYILTSGRKSPVYVDCRKIISYPKERNLILKFAIEYFKEKKLTFDLLAGGETAGIPYAAFLAEKLNKPMIYIRKKPKAFGKNSQIEGEFNTNDKCILIEDLATDGQSKAIFVNAIRNNKLQIKDTFVIFYYNIFKKEHLALSKLGIKIHYLCTWKDILQIVKKQNILKKQDIEYIEKFLFETNKYE